MRSWYWASANNCLVQVDPVEGDQVWLPTYGHGPWEELAGCDEANAALWRSLGFQVHLLPDCHALAQKLGALRCITKELARA